MQLKGEVALHLIDKHLGVAHLLDEGALVREESILDIGSDPVACTADRRRERQIFADKGIEVKAKPYVVKHGTALRQRRTRSEPRRDGEPIQPLCSAADGKLYGDVGGKMQSVGIAVHREGLDRAAEAGVDLREQRPYRIAHRTAAIGPLCTDQRRCSVAVMQEIAGGKEICVFGIRRHFSIGSELCKKIIIVRAALRTVDEIIKQSRGLLVITPEYNAIVCHAAVLSIGIHPVQLRFLRCRKDLSVISNAL